MIRPVLFTYLGMVILLLLIDYRHLKQAAPINRWLFYGLIPIGMGCWLYVITLKNTFFVTLWISHVIQRLLPLP